MSRFPVRIILLATCIFTSALYAQNPKLDSLILVLKTDIHDSLKASTLIEMSREGRFSNQDSSIRWAEMAYDLSVQLKSKHLEGMAIFIISYTYELQGKYKLAMEQCIQALDIFEAISDHAGKGEVFNRMAIIQYRQDQFESAHNYFLKALDEKLLAKDSAAIASGYNNLGVINKSLENYEQAIDYYNRALDIFEKVDDREMVAATLGNIAIINQKSGLLNEALIAQKKALQVFLEIGSEKFTEEAYFQIGSIYLEQNNFKESENYLTKGLQVAEKIHDPEGKAMILEALVQLYRQKNDYRKALESYEKMSEIKDSLFNLDKSKQLTELATKYESESKEKENQLLKQDVESKNLIIATISVVIGLLALLSFLFYRIYRTKKHSHRRLQELNQQVSEQKEELLTQAEELRRSNDTIRNANDNLERMVSSRTQEIKIQNEKLIQYAHSNAHRVRGPLARILGVLNIMKDEGENNQHLLLNIEQLHESANELDVIIKELNKILEEDK